MHHVVLASFGCRRFAPTILPRQIALEGRMTYTELAALDLKRSFGRGSPHTLVASGRCNLNDWLRVLEARRAEFEVAFRNQAQDSKSEHVISQCRLTILGTLEAQTMTEGELYAGNLIKPRALETELKRLQDELMIQRAQDGSLEMTRRGQRTLTYLRHRSVQPLSFTESAQPASDEVQINAA
jgi:hypothetical protein